MKLKDFLIKIDACTPAIEWVGDRTIEQAVAACHRGDWMLFFAEKLNIDKRKIVLCAGHFANSVRHLMKDERSTYAVDAAIAYGEGRITEDELKAAESAAYYAACDAYNAYYAAAEVDASDAADAYPAAYDAARAAYKAAYAAYKAARADRASEARSVNELQTADICRKYIGDLIIEHYNNLTK